ncbi:MAG: NTP transferase domain-containing protein, partial [Candidatus Omnitrophota bacterium]|nr:NTP transferase domain-containing protein [Candidatus Omnitrophota bacterium]
MVLAVIPARYGSTRFPGKPLAMLHGKPMIQQVYEQVAKAKRVDEVVVATDDDRIIEAIERAGGTALLTSATARSGTERAA